MSGLPNAIGFAIVSPTGVCSSSLNRFSGALHSEERILPAILPGLGAFFHQAGCCLLYTPSPIDCDHAERKIRPAFVGTAAFAVEGRSGKTALVAWPSLNARSGMRCAGGVGDTSSETEISPSSVSRLSLTTRPEVTWTILTRGKFGAYLVLKFRLPAIRVAPEADGSAPTPFLRRRAKSVSAICSKAIQD